MAHASFVIYPDSTIGKDLVSVEAEPTSHSTTITSPPFEKDEIKR